MSASTRCSSPLVSRVLGAWLPLICGFALCSACTDKPVAARELLELDSGPPPADARESSAETLQMAVGLGEPGAFLPPLVRESLMLQRGCQGAQHIFTSLRIRGAKGKLVRVEVKVKRADDDMLVSVPMDVRLPLEVDEWSDTARRITGLTPVIESPADVLGRAVAIQVTLTDESNASVSGVVRGVVEWGSDSCGAH